MRAWYRASAIAGICALCATPSCNPPVQQPSNANKKLSDANSDKTVVAIADRLNARADEKPADGHSVGALAKLTLSDEPTSLLGGRLSVRMPATATTKPRGHNIMAAPEAAESETRIIVDADNERLVLMARELYALVDDDLEKAVRADVAHSWGEESATARFEKLSVAPSATAVAFIPQHGDGKSEANLLLVAYFKNEDGTVQFLAFYVNPAGYTDAAGAMDLAKKILVTLKAGSTKLLSKAGPRVFRGFVITAPQGFVASTQKGPDFSVFRLNKLSLLGQAHAGCGIYLGWHPQYHYRQSEMPPDKVDSAKGTMFGQEIEWKTWSKDKDMTTEAIVPHPIKREMSLHVFCTASTEDELKAVRAMAETLRVEEAME
jgi:hypothetical protein